MSKGIYIGNSNKAHKSKKLYIGINNVAHKIKRAYIGDENNKSRLIYISGYSYQKLNGYVWKKYKLNSTHTLNEESTVGFNLGTFTAWKSMYIDSNGIIQLENQYGSDYVAMNLYFENDIWKDYPYLYGHVWDSTDRTYRVDSANGTNVDNMDIKLLTVSSTYSRGSYIGEVTATSRSQYPDNSYSGSYWYVYDRISYTTVESEYKLNEGTQTTLSGMSSQRPSGYPSVWVDENGNITGNGTAYTNTWRYNYSTYKSSYPYIYYNSKWYRIVSATSTSATVVPLTTS